MNVPSGYSALDLVGFTDKGDYSASTNYVKNDLVHYNDKIWKCLIDDTTAIEPTEGVNWTLWIQQSNSLDGLADVEITNAQDGQEITYDGTTQKWKNTSKIQTLTNQVKDMNNILGAKNLLPPAHTQTNANVTYTVKDDGSVTINGTRSSAGGIILNDEIVLKAGETYVYSIGNPFNLSTTAGSNIEGYDGSSWVSVGVNIYGAKTIGEFTASNTYSKYRVKINANNGVVFSNLTIYPMLCLKSNYDLDSSYHPYAKTNRELTEDTTALLDNTEVNGAVNMLPYPYKRGNEVINGITSIVDSDGVITLNGTATAATSFIMFERAENKFALPKGSYKAIVKIVSGTYTDTLSHILKATEGGSGIVKVDKNLGEAGIFSISTDTYIGYQINIPSGAVLTNLKLAPMITVVSYNGDYVPYAMSNRKLTEEKLSLSVLKSVVADSSDFADFKTKIAAL